MNYASMLVAEKGHQEDREQLKNITKNAITCLKDNKLIDTSEFWNFLNEHPTYDCDKPYNCLGCNYYIITIPIIANDIDLCKYLIEKRNVIPTSINVNVACRNGYAEIIELLIQNYKNPSEKDIALWKQTAILNGHHNIAYLIDRLLNRLYIQFSKSNTDYFIRIINTTLKNTLDGAYIEKSPNARPKKVILYEMLEQLTKDGYMAYTMEYLIALKKIVKDSLSISKLFHRGAEDTVTTAINYYRSYKDGIKTTGKRTFDGALLVSI